MKFAYYRCYDDYKIIEELGVRDNNNNNNNDIEPRDYRNETAGNTENCSSNVLPIDYFLIRIIDAVSCGIPSSSIRALITMMRMTQ